MVFCPRCGSKDVIDTLCANCMRETEPLLKGNKDLTLTICPRCMSYMRQGKWTKYKDINALILRHVKSKLVFDPNKIIDDVFVAEHFVVEDLWEKKVKPKKLTLEISGRIGENGKQYSEDYEVAFTIKKDICQVCNRMASNYFEGIIQLRNPKPEVVRYINNSLKKLNSAGVYLTNVIESKEGVDFYVTDQKAIQKLGHDVIERFGGEIKITSKLMTQDKTSGKELYRVTVLLRLPKFEIGNIILYNEVLMRVGKLSKHIHGFDILRNKHTQITVKNYEDIQLMKPEKSSIVTLHPQVTVMNPDTFQPMKVANHVNPETYTINENVKIVKYKDKYYLILDKKSRTK